MENEGCKTCEHICVHYNGDESLIYECRHKENITTETTWYENKEIQIMPPKVRNRNRDCKYYEKSDIPF